MTRSCSVPWSRRSPSDIAREAVGDAATALERWAANRPDLIVLDLGLPDMDGSTVIRVRREATTPILVLSARDEERDKVAALERGADDYVTKPFGVDELRARLRVVLRRAIGPGRRPRPASDRVGPWSLDAASHEVTVDATPVELTPREFEVLRVLVAHRGAPRHEGRPAARGLGRGVPGRGQLRLRLRQPVRRKLAAADPDGALGPLIVTEPGVGYRIRDRDADRRAPAPLRWTPEGILSRWVVPTGRPRPLGPIVVAWTRARNPDDMGSAS